MKTRSSRFALIWATALILVALMAAGCDSPVGGIDNEIRDATKKQQGGPPQQKTGGAAPTNR